MRTERNASESREEIFAEGEILRKVDRQEDGSYVIRTYETQNTLLGKSVSVNTGSGNVYSEGQGPIRFDQKTGSIRPVDAADKITGGTTVLSIAGRGYVVEGFGSTALSSGDTAFVFGATTTGGDTISTGGDTIVLSGTAFMCLFDVAGSASAIPLSSDARITDQLETGDIEVDQVMADDISSMLDRLEQGIAVERLSLDTLLLRLTAE